MLKAWDKLRFFLINLDRKIWLGIIAFLTIALVFWLLLVRGPASMGNSALAEQSQNDIDQIAKTLLDEYRLQGSFGPDVIARTIDRNIELPIYSTGQARYDAQFYVITLAPDAAYITGYVGDEGHGYCLAIDYGNDFQIFRTWKEEDQAREVGCPNPGSVAFERSPVDTEQRPGLVEEDGEE